MIKDVWDSFKDNIKERVTNPFLGTFVLVWIVHNWTIVYAFFYFDKEWKLQTKIDYFQKYWTEHNFILNLIWVAILTVGVLIITYLFLAFARFLSNYFENVITPFVYKISKGKTVTADTHQIALNKIELLETRVETERKAKNEAQQERDEFEKRIYQKAEFQPLENTENTYNRINGIIETRFREKDFKDTILNISKGNPVSENNEVVNFLLEQGFVEFDGRATGGGFRYKFTSIGNDFKKQYYSKYI